MQKVNLFFEAEGEAASVMELLLFRLFLQTTDTILLISITIKKMLSL